MRKYKKRKINLLLTLTILSVLGIGIGYSALTQKLNLDSSVAINEMKWDVGFSKVEDNGGTVLSESSISADGKTLTILCDIGSSTEKQTCITKATITNNSSFDVSLRKNPSIIYSDKYIHSLTVKWNNHPTYENKTVLKDNFVAKGESEEIIITINSKFLSKDNLPEENTEIPVTITLDFEEWEQGTLPTKNELAILNSTTGDEDTTAFRGATYKEKIKTITFENKINIPDNATASWDIGVNAGKVMAYVIPNTTNSSYYDLYIQSDTQLYANDNMNSWFIGMKNVESINGLESLNTSSVTDMSSLFYNTGLNSTSLSLDIDSLDTSSVTTMSQMFYATGKNSTNFSIDISNFDTTNVVTMDKMFYHAGYRSKNFTLDVSNFDTKNVTNMEQMFRGTGYSNPNFILDVGNFDTSKVTSMALMFDGVGYNSTIIQIDVSDWNTSNVTNMGQMFYETGYKNPNFKLDLTNWNTEKVTDMYQMFYETGYNNPNFVLDVSNFNTSKVSDMDHMFYCTGYSNPNFTLDVSNFDTSKTYDMAYMFYQTGYNSTKLNIVITMRNPYLTKYEGIFEGIATKEGAQVIVNYTSETSDLVDAMIATKSANSNVVKGVQIN